MNIPAELAYSTDHEWVHVNGDAARVGITDFAQDALGDVVFVDLPQVGGATVAGEPMGEIESTKSVSDLIAPVSGEITEVNLALEDEPELVNEDPYGDGWICVIALNADSSTADLGELLDAAGYEALIAEE